MPTAITVKEEAKSRLEELHAEIFTDATSVALCRRNDPDAIPSFDTDFDGIVERIEPESRTRSA